MTTGTLPRVSVVGLGKLGAPLAAVLASRGFYRGTPDGQIGGQTRAALRGFQASIGTAADGFASADMLDRLRGR